jgi:hypothetical protein
MAASEDGEAIACDAFDFSCDSGHVCDEWEDMREDSEDEAAHADAFPVVKRKLAIGPHSVAITHDPGDQRFDYGLPMQSHYGYLEGTYGMAMDGKAYDAYIASGYQPGDEMPTLFLVTQTTPDGEPDEEKLMIGYPDLANARASHAYHVGMERSGIVVPLSWDDLEDLYDQVDILTVLKDR